ncbi:hypothetical protein QTP88_022614 [Uroleucon formosanum]
MSFEIFAVIREFLNAMNWTVIIFSTQLLLDMKLVLHTVRLEHKGQSEVQNHHFSKQIMALVFRDHKGIILIEYLPQRETINSGRHCETLKKLRRAIQNKRKAIVWMGCFEPPSVFPRPGAFRLPFVHFPEETHWWKKVLNRRGGEGGARQVDKGGGGRVLRDSRYQKNESAVSQPALKESATMKKDIAQIY